MKKIIKVIISISLLSLFCLASIPNSTAYNDERISVYTYFTWMQEDGSWHEWINTSQNGMVKDITIKIGQPVKVKINITPKVRCSISIMLSEISSSNLAFDLLQGKYDASDRGNGFIFMPIGTDLEKELEEAIKWGPPPEYFIVGETLEYAWVLQPNDYWACEACSATPLNIYWGVGFTTQDRVSRDLTIANPLIRGEWTGPSYTPTNPDTDGTTNTNTDASKKSTPGFDLPLLFISFIALAFIMRRLKHR